MDGNPVTPNPGADLYFRAGSVLYKLTSTGMVGRHDASAEDEMFNIGSVSVDPTTDTPSDLFS